MPQFAFLSIIYWLNFGILIGLRCIDILSVFYFYIFLVFYVFPIGHMSYEIFFQNKSPFEQSFLVLIKFLIAIPIIAAVNFLFGINYSVNLSIFFLSCLYILYSNRVCLFSITSISRIAISLLTINIRDYKGNMIFVTFLSAMFTIISINSFRIFNYFPDHVSILGHPSDGSSYYAIISSFVNHTGSFILGCKSTLFSGANMSAFRFTFEIFESVFVKLFEVDIVLFQSVIISQSLILLLFCIAFLPCFQPNSLENTEIDNPWNSIFLGLVIIILFSYFRQISLLLYSMAAFHSFFSWMYILTAIKILLSTENFLNNKIDTHLHTNIALVFILFLMGTIIHVVYNIIFFMSFLIYLLYRQFNKKQKKYFSYIWVFTILISITLLGSIFKNHPFVFGDWRISISSFSANWADIQRLFNDLFFLKPIYTYLLAFISSNSVAGNIIGSFYSIFCFSGYFFVILLYYFLFMKSNFKLFYGNALLGIYLVLLIINNQLSVRPSFLAMYMPNVTMLLIAFLAIEIVLANNYFKFQKAHNIVKISLLSFLSVIVLAFNTLAFTKPYSKLDISNSLYDVIMYVKKNTPQNSMILHNIKNSSYYAYFSGFAYRNSVMERSAYAYVFISNAEEIINDIDKFCKNSESTEGVNILNKYHVTHVLSSPECPLDLQGDKFQPIFSNSEYKLYRYSN
ncbi:MAG: hypothetical protein M0T82_10115 [Desulfobacteraceae bacterium]|nr:hypothetical protein [Desulfobacteraceae bacterium]